MSADSWIKRFEGTTKGKLLVESVSDKQCVSANTSWRYSKRDAVVVQSRSCTALPRGRRARVFEEQSSPLVALNHKV